MGLRLVTLAFFAVLFHLISPLQATTESCNALPPDNVDCRKPGKSLRYCLGSSWGNVFWISSQAPLARAFPTVHIPVITYFQQLFATIPERVRLKRSAKNLRRRCKASEGILDDGSFEEDWYNVQRSWKTAALGDQNRIGIKPSNTSCFTEINLSAEESEQVWPQLMVLDDATLKMGKRVKDEAVNGTGSSLLDRELRCWPSMVSPMMRAVRTNTFQCKVGHAIGIRREKNIFNLQTSLTSLPVNRSAPEKMRHYLSEQFQVKGNRIHSPPIPSFRVGDSRGPVNDTTTVVATWGGDIKISFYMSIPNAEGPAMRYTAEMSNKNRDSIEDGVAVSNIAILVLPCLLATVPLAAIEEVSRSRTLLIYIIITDIISVLPLAIKGVEMLVQARSRYFGCVAWAVGVEAKEGIAVIELWCANCTHHTLFQVYGWSFLSVALVFMGAGIALEIFAYRVQQQSQRGIHYNWWWGRRRVISRAIPACTEYDCHGPFATTCGSSGTREPSVYFARRRSLNLGLQEQWWNG